MSGLEQHLVNYLQLRHSLGHELRDAAWLLPSFVDYLDAQGLSTVTVESALAWTQQPATDTVTTVGPRRMTAVRGFARYLSGIDAGTEVPAGLERRSVDARRLPGPPRSTPTTDGGTDT